MKYRYSLVDFEADCENELVIGYCNKIDGLDGKIVEIDGELFHKVVFLDIHFCDEYIECLKEKKMQFPNIIYIKMHDNNMKMITKFTFGINTKIKPTEVESLKSHIDFELIGCLNEIASDNELCLWEKWIECYPKEKNEWVALDAGGRRDWLRMLRVAHCCGYNKVKENTEKVFYLDGKNITTYDSFFIAFAEALNGPGTYFGASLDGLDDCLYGRFGIKPPFKVIWENSSIAVKYLDGIEYNRHKSDLKELFKRELDDEAAEELDNNDLALNIFHSIIEILLCHGVEVVLKP